MTSTPDARLLEAHDLARAALAEVTPAATIGEPAGHTVEDDGVVSLRFANRLGGYPGWFWTVSVAAAAPDVDPTVLEVELLPGDGALVAPDWVPWAVRLADYQAAQAALAEAAAEAGSEDDVEIVDLEDDDADLDDEDDLNDEDDDDDEDEDDLDDDEVDDEDDELDIDGSPILHAGDLDGVDIDELDADSDDADADAADAGDDADADAADPGDVADPDDRGQASA